MAESLRVTTADLHVSAETVDVHADTMRTRHAVADGNIEAAHGGLPAGSATALAAAVAKWQGDTFALYGQLVDHGHGLRNGAAAYANTDERAAEEVDAAGRKAAGLDLGL